MRRTTAVIAAVGVVLLAGCTSHAGEEESDGNAREQESDAMLNVATRYQDAVSNRDWRTVCTLKTPALRFGDTIDECVENLTPSTPVPDRSTPSPSFSPPTYADGSTPEPISSRTPSGPEYAETGPAEASDVIEVPIFDDHPTGYGVLVSHTVKWPGKPATTSRHALRLVKQGDTWAVDQYEDVQQGDYGPGSPVRNALSS